MMQYLFRLLGPVPFVLLLLSPAMMAPASAQNSTPMLVEAEEARRMLSVGGAVWGGLKKPATPTDKVYQALRYYAEGENKAASAAIEEVRVDLSNGGFRNAPSLSFELLRAAQQAVEQGATARAMELISQARVLSPSHPRVLLAVATFYDVIGFSQAARTVLEAAMAIAKYPVLAATISLNSIVVVGLSLTLALLFVSVVQLLRSGEFLVKQLGRLFPRPVAGLFGTVLLPVILVGPLYLGLLGALAVWSMVLSIYRPNCRNYAFVVGAVILLWAWIIPNVRILGIQTQATELQALEEVNAGNFYPEGEQLLMEQALSQNPESPALFGAAMLAQRYGQNQLARNLYRKLTSGMYLTTSLQQAVMLNTAVLLYEEQKFAEALGVVDRLEKQGLASFELLHNRSLIHMGLLETEKYREYYERARAIDAQRLDVVMLTANNGVADPEAAQLALADMWMLLRANASTSQQDAGIAQTLTSALFYGGTTGVMELLAGITMFIGVLGLLGSVKQHKRRRVSTTFLTGVSTRQQGSAMWCVLPAGYAIAGKYPVAGACYLALVIAAVLLALGAPMHFFSVMPMGRTISSPFLIVAATLLVLSMCWSLVLYRRASFPEE